MRNLQHLISHQTILSLRLVVVCLIALAYAPVRAGTLRTPPPPDLDSAVNTSLPQAGPATFPPFTPQFSGCGGGMMDAVNNYYEQRVVDLVNAERAAAGKPPLKRMNQLDLAARFHAADMWQDGYFNHDTYDFISGQFQKICVWSSRLTTYYSNWTDLGENIAAGYPTPEEVMAGWMGSSGHKANILRDTFYELGVGYYNGFWVQDFGRRSNVFPVVINSEAQSTNNRNVTLYIYGSWTEMRIRENADPWTGWQPFQNTISWQLSNIGGEHLVYVEMRKTGVSASSSDSISLDLPQQPALGDLPDVITFTYSTATTESFPAEISIPVNNTGSQTLLNWQASTDVLWLSLQPSAGVTPGTLTIAVENVLTETVGVHTGSITLNVTSPPGVSGAPQTILVKLWVLNTPPWKLYFPITKK